MNSRLGKISDIQGVLNLQAANLSRNLTEEEKEKGFVTTPFTVKQIENIISQNGLFVTEHQGKIIAYVFAGTWEYFSQWEIFNFMVNRFPTLKFKGKSVSTQNSFQYGPICIDENFRGKNLINAIFETMRLEWKKRYPLSITFINKVNQPSTKAHVQKLGWEIIDEFDFKDGIYLGLAFDMEKSVLNLK